MTDRGLAELAGLKSLAKLTLADTGVTTEGLKQLAGSNFLVLKLPAGSYNDDGLAPYLNAIAPRSDLDLSEWSLSDEGLVHLANQQQLKSLVVDGTAPFVGVLRAERVVSRWNGLFRQKILLKLLLSHLFPFQRTIS